MQQRLIGMAAVIAVALAACSDSSDNPPQSGPPLLSRYELSSSDSVPEGIAFDPRRRDFYATSLQGGSITRVSAAGGESLLRDADGRAALGGAKVDPRRRLLWVCATQVDGVDNRVWVFALDNDEGNDEDNSELKQEYLLGALSTNGACNDLALDDAGVAYVTDPMNPYIYRLDPDTGEGEVLVTDPLLADQTGVGLGLNGIAVTPDGSALLVAKFAPAQLLRVDLTDATVSRVALGGDTLPSPDGIVFLDGDLYSVSDSAVSRVRLNSDFSAGDVVVAPQVSGLSTATVAEDRLYVIKSEVTRSVVGLPLELPFAIFEVDRSVFGP